MENLIKEIIEIRLYGKATGLEAQSISKALLDMIEIVNNKNPLQEPRYGEKRKTESHQMLIYAIAQIVGKIGDDEIAKLQRHYPSMLLGISSKTVNLLRRTLLEKRVAENEAVKNILNPKFYKEISTKHGYTKVEKIEKLILQMYLFVCKSDTFKNPAVGTAQLLLSIIPTKADHLDTYLNEHKQLMVFRYLKDAVEKGTSFSEKDKIVFKNYFYNDRDMTMRELGGMLYVSHETIRLIKNKLTEMLICVADITAEAEKDGSLPNYFTDEFLSDEDYTSILNDAEGVNFNRNFYDLFFNRKHSNPSNDLLVSC